jgi:high-affinity iron transporter
MRASCGVNHLGIAGMAAVFFCSAALIARDQHASQGHRHPAAQKLKNPVAGDPASIKAGEQLYEKSCAECHGDTGKGDGMTGEGLDPPPADLTDADWKHGSSDGEIFIVIRDGVPNTDMKAFRRKLTERQIWDLTNYIRTLAVKATKNQQPH